MCCSLVLQRMVSLRIGIVTWWVLPGFVSWEAGFGSLALSSKIWVFTGPLPWAVCGYLLTVHHPARGHCRIPGAESQVAHGPRVMNCYLCVLMLLTLPRASALESMVLG